jgi:hypothetical protein
MTAAIDMTTTYTAEDRQDVANTSGPRAIIGQCHKYRE